MGEAEQKAWRARLDEAARLIEAAADAPAWLATAVRKSVASTDLLAPKESDGEGAPPDFFYPH